MSWGLAGTAMNFGSGGCGVPPWPAPDRIHVVGDLELCRPCAWAPLGQLHGGGGWLMAWCCKVLMDRDSAGASCDFSRWLVGKWMYIIGSLVWSPGCSNLPLLTASWKIWTHVVWKRSLSEGHLITKLWVSLLDYGSGSRCLSLRNSFKNHWEPLKRFD